MTELGEKILLLFFFHFSLHGLSQIPLRKRIAYDDSSPSSFNSNVCVCVFVAPILTCLVRGRLSRLGKKGHILFAVFETTYVIFRCSTSNFTDFFETVTKSTEKKNGLSQQSHLYTAHENRFFLHPPFTAVSLKLHKEPNRPFHRAITGHSAKNVIGDEHNKEGNLKFAKHVVETSLTALGKMLSTYLDAVIDLLILRDKQQQKHGQPRRIWIVRDSEEAISVVENSKVVQTDDFTNMYTSLDQAEILREVPMMIQLALQWLNDAVFKRQRDRWKTICFSAKCRENGLTHLNKWYHGTPMWDNWNYEWPRSSKTKFTA